MNSSKIVNIVLQILALAPSVIPTVQRAVQQLKDAVDSGKPVDQAEIDAIVSRIQSQSDTIQQL